MYCKYCGSKITVDTTKCMSCGANIDLNDGGQSFFDDNEISSWQSDSVSYNSYTTVPKTEMREYIPENDNFNERYENIFAKPQMNIGTSSNYARPRSKKKKKSSGYLSTSSSNKLIIFCIASAVAIVLLVVAIIAVLNSGNDTADERTDEIVTQTIVPEYIPRENNATVEPDINQPTSSEMQNDAVIENETVNPENTEDVLKGKIEIKDIKILDMDGKKIPHSVQAYIDENNTLYVSLDKILKYKGYKNGFPNSTHKNRIQYEHKLSKKVIEIEKGTDKIWISENSESPDTKHLDSVNFNVGDNTYIPIKSFLIEYGYDENNIRWDENEKVLSLCGE